MATPHEAQTPKRIAFKRVAIPVSLKDKEYLKGRGICCSEHFLPNDTNKQKEIKVSDVLPSVFFPSSSEEAKTNANDHTIPQSLVNKLPAPEKVKTFKSLAHKK